MLFAAPATAGAMMAVDDTTIHAASDHQMSDDCGAGADFCDPGCTACSCACCHLSLPLAAFEVALVRGTTAAPRAPATRDIPLSYLPELPPPLV